MIVAVHRRRVLIWLVTAGLIVLALVPAVVVFGLGWLPLPHVGQTGGSPAEDTSTLEQWTLFALFYLAWMFAVTVFVIWSFDHLGHHWQSSEGKPRVRRKSRRRARATMRHVNAEQQAAMQAMRRREEREARRRADRDSAEARRRGPDGGR